MHDLVKKDGTVSSLQKVILAQRETKPDAQVCYMSLKQDAENPKEFEVTKTHRVIFQPVDAGESATPTQGNIGCKDTPQFWMSSGVVSIIWVVRWTAKGLMPVRPEVILTKGVLNLGPGRFCNLHPADGA